MNLAVEYETYHGTGPRDEVASAVRWLAAQRRHGHDWGAMALVVPGKRKWDRPAAAVLAAEGVPHRFLIGRPDEGVDGADAVLAAVSLYTVTDRPIVAVVGLGDLPWKAQSRDEAERALAAATRGASSACRLSYSKRSALVERLTDGRDDGPTASDDVTSRGSDGRTRG